MTDEMKLKPCPFCGSSAVDPEGWTSLNPATGKRRCGPACDDCGASAESASQWNTRVAPSSPGEGWVMVPREPTGGMIRAAGEGTKSPSFAAIWPMIAREIYLAMLSAAPSPGGDHGA